MSTSLPFSVVIWLREPIPRDSDWDVGDQSLRDVMSAAARSARTAQQSSDIYMSEALYESLVKDGVLKK